MLKFKDLDSQYGYLLNDVNGYSLDKQQRQIVYDESQNLLVVAGAGCGKTTTIVGKIIYLLDVKKIKPNQILCLSFTNETVNNLKIILQKNNIYDINVKTFHKLGLSYINYQTIISDDFLSFLINEYLELQNTLTKTQKIIWQKEIFKIIKLCQGQNFGAADFFKVKLKIKNKFYLYLLYLVIDIYLLYSQEKRSIQAIDFEDMLIEATKNVKNQAINYKYIIIDEYQDSSLIKMELIQAIIAQSKAKLMVVGDDYQSIYQFNGSNLNLFLNFSHYFPQAKKRKITNTYRTSKELITTAGNFIMKNKQQIRKKINAKFSLPKPLKIVCYQNNKSQMLYKTILYLCKLQIKNITILGRNNFDLQTYLDNFNLSLQDNKIILKDHPEINIIFLTIHKAKGLEWENVIILNLENTLYGLPNQVENSTFYNFFLQQRKDFKYAEERRIFYVALTRAKKYGFLLTNKNNPSIFVKELLHDYAKNIELLSWR